MNAGVVWIRLRCDVSADLWVESGAFDQTATVMMPNRSLKTRMKVIRFCPTVKQVSVTDHNGIDSVISHISLPGVSFGELSLMYGKPRTATVTCVKAGWLWCLERKAFRGILVDRMTHDNTVKILRKVSGGARNHHTINTFANDWWHPHPARGMAHGD